jgi:hypothetical protein
MVIPELAVSLAIAAAAMRLQPPKRNEGNSYATRQGLDTDTARLLTFNPLELLVKSQFLTINLEARHASRPQPP